VSFGILPLGNVGGFLLLSQYEEEECNIKPKKCHKLLHKAITQQRFFPLFTKRRYGEKTVLIQCEPEIVLIFQENYPKNVRKSTTTDDNGSVSYHFDNTWVSAPSYFNQETVSC
jgi:hypothetical protein